VSTRTLKPIVPQLPLQVIVTICAGILAPPGATWPGRDVKYIKLRLSPTGYDIPSGATEPKIADSRGKKWTHAYRAQSRSTYLNSVCYFYAPKAYNLALPGSGLPSKCSLEMNWWIYRGDWHLPTQSRNSMRGEDSHGCVTPDEANIAY